MDAVVESPAAALTPLPPPAPQDFKSRLAALPQATKIKLGVGIAGLAATLIAMAMWANQGDWKVLYANLPDKEAGAILAQLQQMNVPYKHTEGGAAILVPAERVYDVKMKLATAGLPKANVAGNELLDNPRFGRTDRQERSDHQRALEGELVRTISQLDGVEGARVHLAMPNQNGFFREQQKASASVMITMHAGRSLDRAQAAAIVHLVSSSVPELNPKAVSVLDQSGTLLSGPDETGRNLNEEELKYQRQVEATYLQRVKDILEPVLGRENMRATVTAEIDFTQTEATSEQYRPNQGDQPAAVRSQQTLESNQAGTPTPSGVPGATTNQPPTPATAPVNGASAPLQATQTGTSGGGGRREAVTNYEVDKTVRVTRAPVGGIKRLNAAVVVNYRLPTPDPKAKGKTEPKPESPPQEELDKLTALVQEAVGFSKDRGDSVKVISAPFRAEEAPKPEELPLWQQPWARDLLRAALVPGALVIVALGLIFGAIRPAIKAAQPLPPEAELTELTPTGGAAGGQLDAVVDDATALPGPEGGGLPALEAPQENSKLEAARRLARDNPAAVANIMREWVTGVPA